MGCFNIHGFYSHLPITCGDRIGAVICANTNTTIAEGIEVTSNGLIPMAAPIYGQYNDYGGIENTDSSPTLKLFEKLTGHTLEEFNELIGRNSETTIFTKDNGNEFDNIPAYQDIIKHFMPVIDTQYVETLEAALGREKNTDVRAQYESLLEHAKAENAKWLNASFMIIYEHEDILKTMIERGKTYSEQFSAAYYDKRSYESLYDDLTEFLNLADKNIFQSNAESDILLDGIEEHSKKSDNLEKPNDMRSFMDMFKLCNGVRQILFDNWMEYSPYFANIYRLSKYDSKELKGDILGLIYLCRGLKLYGGTFDISTYAGQDINKSDFSAMEKMQNVINDVIKKLKENYEC